MPEPARKSRARVPSSHQRRIAPPAITVSNSCNGSGCTALASAMSNPFTANKGPLVPDNNLTAEVQENIRRRKRGRDSRGNWEW